MTQQTQSAPALSEVTIIIPTYQRSAALKNVLESISNKLQTNHKVSVLIVDNNPLPQEKAFIGKYAQTFRFPIEYLHEPNSGVSYARNSGLSYIKTKYVAFLDDDMEISPNWIDSLMKVTQSHHTAVTFGPIEARFPEDLKDLEPYIGSFYSRHGRKDFEGLTSEIFGTGGCLLDMEQIRPINPKFDPVHNASGGEDDAYFTQLGSAGLKFGWSSEANCYEIVPSHRLTRDYIFRRNFGYGQAPSRIAKLKGIKGLPNLLRHLSVGFVQIIVFSPIYLCLALLKRPSALKYLGLSSRGFGKVFFMNSFRPQLYGPNRKIKKN